MRLIDADALMNTLQELLDKRDKEARFTGGRGVTVTWNDAICRIKTAPTIEPQRWIPVSEKLPERNKMDSTGKYREAYLVTTGHMTFTARFDEYGYWVLWGYGQVLKNIIAWMPLPKPYKEEKL